MVVLNTVITGTTTAHLAGRPRTPVVVRDAPVAGFTHGCTVVAIVLGATAVVIAVLMNTARPDRRTGAEHPAPAPAHLG